MKYSTKVRGETTEEVLCQYFYRPQRSCGKVVFYTCLSFCSQGRRGVSGTHPWQTPPSRQTPPGQTPPMGRHPPWADTPLPNACWDTHPPCSTCWDTVHKRTVRILLECIFVLLFVDHRPFQQHRNCKQFRHRL